MIRLDERVSLGGVTQMSVRELFDVDRAFGRAHAACRLEPADCLSERRIGEPVTRRHRRAVEEEG
jgi:hypothetical protein